MDIAASSHSRLSLSPSQMVLHLKAMSPEVNVSFSEYTGQWYVSGGYLEIGDGVLCTGVTEHRDTADMAVRAFFERLLNLEHDQYVVGSYWGHRREYRWNGVTFAECTRPEVLARQAAHDAD